MIGHRTANNHADYAEAKSGDFVAAMRLASDLVTDTYVAAIRERIGIAKPIVVPVRSVEQSGVANAIPEAGGKKS